MRARVGEKGQVTIPKPLRDSLGVRPGDELEFEEEAGTIRARRVTVRDPIAALVGLVADRTDADAYLAEARGPAWSQRLDGEPR